MQIMTLGSWLGQGTPGGSVHMTASRRDKGTVGPAGDDKLEVSTLLGVQPLQGGPELQFKEIPGSDKVFPHVDLQ